MTGKTHLAAGVALGLSLSPLGVVPVAASVLGSVLPDIDSPDSIVGRYVPILPNLLPHRTVTHSFLFVILAGLVNPFLALGVMLHIILDCCNPKGVKLLWPLGSTVRVPLLHKIAPQDGLLDHILGILFGVAALALAAGLIIHGSVPR